MASKITFALFEIVAVVMLILLSIQYPLQTTFPIGGDATRYILAIKQAAAAFHQSMGQGAIILFTYSWYPAATALFATSQLLPIDWPTRFVWWMSLGEIISGLSLGFFLYKLKGRNAAAVGIAAWALTTMSVTPHIQDGTLAQLWSLAAVSFFLLCLSRGAPLYTLFWLITAFLLHPISGIICLLTMMATFISIFPVRNQIAIHHKHFAKAAALVLLVALLVAAIIFWTRFSGNVLSHYEPGNQALSLGNALTSAFGPILILAPFGLIQLIKKQADQKLLIATLLSFTTISTILTFNNRAGVDVYTNRLQSYFVMAVVILAALGLPKLFETAFRTRWIRSAVIILFFVSLGLFAWHENAITYHAYESPARYLRLHPEEQAAILWMRDNLPPGSFVVTSDTTRHLEWIPILASVDWQRLDSDDPLWQLSADQLPGYLSATPYTHLVFFKRIEKPTEAFPNGIEQFPTIYDTDSARILQLKP